MQALLLKFLKKAGTELLLQLLEQIMTTLRDRPDNEVSQAEVTQAATLRKRFKGVKR